ncbi:Dolichyl-phosphate-mannose-protein mannosyltransferase [Asanoa hainanensis]|uniref:Dolichyl-phosphate-mannose-protein mannosyltransferase n=1 Tax=Asanoa hainanensis TaxID=560556 RepID=A0A239PAT2_9ACTN|nr:glycosyltransferase family 39 protein [Asanoa hainanensis]SNT64032.1 Dolichyl-phosphate-mannose-protein mannosyltransferase [Asanoa hainanensis]
MGRSADFFGGPHRGDRTATVGAWTNRLAAGLGVGVGLYNKHLVLLTLVAIGVGLAAVGSRRVFASRWLWAGVAVALVVGSPNVVYQVTHGWPQLELADAIREDKGADGGGRGGFRQRRRHPERGTGQRRTRPPRPDQSLAHPLATPPALLVAVGADLVHHEWMKRRWWSLAAVLGVVVLAGWIVFLVMVGRAGADQLSSVVGTILTAFFGVASLVAAIRKRSQRPSDPESTSPAPVQINQASGDGTVYGVQGGDLFVGDPDRRHEE